MASHVKDKIYVVGYPRSGTTMMAGILSANIYSEAAPETNFINDFLARRISRFNLQFCSADVASYPRIADMNINLPKSINSSSGYLSSFEILLDSFKGVEKVKYIIEKTPRHYEYIDILIGSPTLRKIVVVVRDPRATILSNINAEFRDNKDASWMALDWVYFSRQIRNFSNLDVVVPVKYEDVVTSPDTVITWLYKQCGLPPDSYDISQSTGRHIPEWECAWKSKTIHPDSKSLSSWKRELSCDQIRKIESICADEMKYWGYHSEHTVNRVKKFLTFFSNNLYFIKRLYKLCLTRTVVKLWR